MLSLSTADGFMSVKEGVDDMIKYIANEPSVGLYFVQQHAQASMPYLLDVKEQVVQKIHNVSLHTEDVEDSIDAVRSMTEFGLIQSTTNAGVITLNSGNNSGHRDTREGRGYFSTVLNSAKQKAAGLRRINQQSTVDRLIQSSSQSPFASGSSVPSHAKVDELPVSSSLRIGENPMELGDDSGSYDHNLYQLQDFSKFNEDKEANFETWLQESEEQYRFLKHDD